MSARLPIGMRRHLVTLEAPVDVADDNGGVVRTYAAAASFWARIVPKSDAMIFSADQQAQAISHEFFFRARAGLTGAMRLRDGDRIFRILTLEDFDEKGAATRARCEEVRP